MRGTLDDIESSTVLDRFLSPFATVRPREGLTALLLMVNVFLLLGAYYIIKPVREALILGDAGAEIKSYAGAVQALLFIFIVPLYSYFAGRANRIRLINGVTAFFVSNLALFYLLGRAQLALGVPFFLWVGLFNLMLVAQFWIFANDIYTEEQGKRLFAIVGIGSSLGAIVGAHVAGKLFDPIGPYSMMLVAAGILIVCMFLTNWIHRREKSRDDSEPISRHSAKRQSLGPGSGGFQLVLRHRYLLLIALLVLLSNFVNTTGEFILGKTVAAHAESVAAESEAKEVFIGEFYSDFFFWVNLLGAVFQMFIVSRLIKHIGVAPSLFMLPAIALCGYTMLAFVPMLPFIRVTKIFENSADYSIQNTARHSLFLTTSREEKYKAKAAIDTFFWRSGDALSGALVFLGTQLAFGVRTFALVNSALVILWIGVVAAIARLRRNSRQSVQEAA